MKIAFYILVFTFLSSNWSKAQDMWTLQACLDSAIANNNSIKQSDLDAQIANIRHNQSKYAFTPSVNASVNQSFSSGRSFNFVTNTLTFETTQNTNLSVNGSLSLFEGLSRYYTLQQTSLLIENERYNKEIRTRMVKLEVATFYLQTLVNYENLKLSKEHLNYTLSQEKRMTYLIEAGARVENDMIEISSQKAQDNLSIMKAKNSFQMSMQGLKQVMRVDAKTTFSVDTIVNATLVNTIADEFSVEKMPEIKQSEILIESALLEIKKSKARYYPSLSLSGGLDTRYSDNYFTVDEGDSIPYVPSYKFQFDENFGTFFGFYLSIPIYNQLNTRTSVQLNQIQYEKSVLDNDQAKWDMINTVNQLYIDISNAKGELDAAILLLQMAQKDYNNTELKYQNGTINYSELLNKKDRLFNAESNLIQSKYNFVFKQQIVALYYE